MKKKLLVLGALGVAGIVGAKIILAEPDPLLKDYIKTALVNGCKPVIDVCTSNCVNKIEYDGPPACLPATVIKASPQEAVDAFVQLAQDNGVQVKSIEDYQTMPYLIREKLKTVEPIQPAKEPLFEK